MNGGSCQDGINTYICECAKGYTGSNCQFEINECDSSPCKNRATCVHHVGNYTCHCPFGYTGLRCETLVDWCNTNPCLNGATCKQNKNTYKCICRPGWTGTLCDVSMVSCSDAALQKGTEVRDLCKNGGTCENIGNSHRCSCSKGYEGSYCQHKINECAAQPCQNGAICRDLVGQYRCDCLPGFKGLNCEFNIDDCDPNPCRNGGTCHDQVNNFVCSCPHGTLGILCENNVNECFEGACHHGGSCIDKVGGYECRCPPGFVGPRCEGDVNECLSNPCNNPGVQDCVHLINNYRCECKPGFMGRHCETRIDFCLSKPCLNGGICNSGRSGPICVCPDGFWGEICNNTNTTCASSPCKNGGQCRQHRGGYSCICLQGTTGKYCDIDIYDECESSPCLNRGECINKIGKFECLCPANWNGLQCESFDTGFRGGVGTMMTPGVNFQNLPEEEKEKCAFNKCRLKAGDRHCDEDCNNFACNFDGGDCSLGLHPWENCTAAVNCWDVFRNGKCDLECNNVECLFDGFDCTQKLPPCNEMYDSYCQKNYANGKCDYGCNNEECNWDGLDCEEDHPRLAVGQLVITLLIDSMDFERSNISFLREIGHALRTNVRIKTDNQGNQMIYPWRTRIDVHLEIDNRQCLKSTYNECFQTAAEAARFLAASRSRHSLDTAFQIESIQSSDELEKPRGPKVTYPNMVYIVIGVIVIILLGLLLGVLVTTQRKRVHGITWFPEGFFRNNNNQKRQSRRRGPDGQEMRNLQKQASAQRVDANDNNTIPTETGGWSDDDMGDHPPVKKMKCDHSPDPSFGDTHTVMTTTDYDENDPRPWTQQHLDAADVRNPHVLALTPPQRDSELEPGNVDVRGPGGLTPLMLASFRGGGLDTGEDAEEDDGSVSMIQDLITQGAKINMTTERTGETSLHLAARYARADAAKRLLDAGADANSQDNTGRTPLHASVSADAQGVFQILLRNRATNLNARMHDGTTPLILASRLAIEGMVEDLINAEADLNASDDAGTLDIELWSQWKLSRLSLAL
ncbi:neurogenic locus Notch protein-like [Limulus polyphemus]|uniref:Neurogenic locus Notch protein-like n=1 Tax=Limulus polyphemus TaxID=6850 RepID=A0ABM1RW22_LIMPO|nr:neurogenic locus Notch protein-like [Limulus polyphemus]